MAARYLLDTNICIHIQRERPPAVLAKFGRLKRGDAAISAITWGELMYGAAKSTQSERVSMALQEFATLVPVLALDSNVGVEYGEIRATLECSGRIIGNNDLWIAAHARCERLILVTNNTREFERVPNLKIQNWAA